MQSAFILSLRFLRCRRVIVASSVFDSIHCSIAASQFVSNASTYDSKYTFIVSLWRSTLCILFERQRIRGLHWANQFFIKVSTFFLKSFVMKFSHALRTVWLRDFSSPRQKKTPGLKLKLPIVSFRSVHWADFSWTAFRGHVVVS